MYMKTDATTAPRSAALVTEPNLGRPDDFYEALIDTHRGLTDDQSRDVNCKLVLLLANHIGDMDVLREAMAIARRGYDDKA